MNSICGSFFQLEFDRIREKLRMLVLELEHLVDLITKRKLFLLKLCDFDDYARNVEDDLKRTIIAASKGQEIDLERTTNDVTEACSRLNALGDDLIKYQTAANIRILDYSVSDIVQRICDIPMQIDFSQGIYPCSSAYERFLAVSKELRSVILQDFQIGSQSPDDLHNYLVLIQENKEKERKMFNDLDNLSTQTTELEKEDCIKTISMLKELSDKRHRDAKEKMQETVEVILNVLRERLEDVEGTLNTLMAEENADEIRNFVLVDWKLLKDDLSLTRKALKDNSEWSLLLEPLSRKIEELEERLAKLGPQEGLDHEIITEFPSFSRWLDEKEDELEVDGKSAANTDEKTERRLCILKESVARVPIVRKLKDARLLPEQNDTVEVYCRRYLDVIRRILLWDVPERFDVYAEYLSQLSLFERELTASYPHHERMVKGDVVTDEEQPSCSAVYDLANALAETDDVIAIRELFPMVDDEINQLNSLFNSLTADYAKSLKPLEEASYDSRTLQDAYQRSIRLGRECERLSNSLTGDDRAKARAFANVIRSLHGQMEVVLKDLISEIEDEKTLATRYKSIIDELCSLDAQVKGGRRDIGQVWNEFESIEESLEQLRDDCIQRRRYVINSSYEEEEEERASQEAVPATTRKQIILMISRTVTTIIQIVEDELRRTPCLQEEELNEMHRKLKQIETVNEMSLPSQNWEKEETRVKNLIEDVAQLLSEVDEVRRTSGDPSEVENQLKIVDNVEQSVLATLTSLDAV
ncbi:hypothetical protein AB6A40_007980, partial [Gnathostoma spinigerum]